MNIYSSVIRRMRNRLPFLEKRVIGASQYEQMERDQTSLKPPFAVVLPNAMKVDKVHPSSSGARAIDISYSMEIAITLDTTNDDRNQIAAGDGEELDGYIISLLFGYTPAKNFDEMVFLNRDIFRDDSERLIYTYYFSVTKKSVESKCFDEMEALEDGGFIINRLSNSNLNVNGIQNDLCVECEECP